MGDVRNFLKRKKSKEYSKFYQRGDDPVREPVVQYEVPAADGRARAAVVRDVLRRTESVSPPAGLWRGRDWRNMPSYTYMLLQLMTMLDIPNVECFRKHTLHLLRHEEKLVGLEKLFQKSVEAGWVVEGDDE